MCWLSKNGFFFFFLAAVKAKTTIPFARLVQIYSPLSEIFGTRYVLDFRVFPILKGITVCLPWNRPQKGLGHPCSKLYEQSHQGIKTD